MALHQLLEDGLLGWLKGSAFPAAPSTIYLSLHAGTPVTSVNEISSNFGGRQALTAADLSALTWEGGIPDSSRQMSNSRGIVYELAISTVTVAGWRLWDAGTSGNLLVSGEVLAGGTITAGDPAVILAGDLVVKTN